MKSLFLLALALFVAASAGRRLLGLLQAVPHQRLDRFVYSTSLGLGVIAYVVLSLGLLGFLTIWPVTASLVAILLVCWTGMLETLLDLQPRARVETEEPRPKLNPGALLAGPAILLIGGLVVVNCFVPPGPHEWDALSYHLAAPKVYLANHRIVFLPTDHHSNFPFLVEMLFTLGLLFDGYALANLFHFALGALTVGSIVFIARRHFSPGAGWIGSLVFATTPIVVWEAGAAYIELGLCVYVLLAMGAALEFRREGNPRWLVLAGILMGFALSVKALALVPFALLACAILLSGYRFKNLRWYLAPAILVGCPFYVKSIAFTGNPVYPFAYRVFGGKYFSQQLADAYSGTQTAFGLHQNLLSASEDLANVRPDELPPSPFHRLRNLVLAPFALVSVPRIFYDYQDPGTFTQLGFLFIALPPLVVIFRGRNASVSWIGGVAAAWFAAWSFTMEYVRYIVPVVPLLGLAGGEGGCRAIARVRGLKWLVGGAAFFQTALVLSYNVPRLFANSPTDPGQWELATSAEAREKYLTRRLNYYSSAEWLNHHAPSDAGIVLFEEARGFYLDRPYLWGNELHSTYIPYSQFATGREMADWFLDHRIRYALINLQFTHEANSNEGQDELRRASSSGELAPLFLKWYDPKRGGERFRGLLGDALLDGAAAIVAEATLHGTVVLEFRRSPAR